MERDFTRRSLLAGAGALAFGVYCSRPTVAQSLAWRQIQPASEAPSPRWDHTLVADSSGGALWLYGGRDNDGNPFDDTWRYDLTSDSWTLVDGSGPAARFGATAALAGDSRGFLMYGGQAGSTFFNDTWRFDFDRSEWTLEHDGSADAPAPRYGLGSAYLPDGHFVISHGFTFDGRYDDTWRFDPVAKMWHAFDLSSPRPLNRCLHEMILLPSSKVLLYGGCSSGFGPCPQGDAWVFDADSGLWTDVTPAAGPAARSNPSLVWSATLEHAILFGGQAESGKSAELWAGSFDGRVLAWSLIQTVGEAPSPRSSHDAVVLDNQMYLFGGLADNGATGDLWVLNV